MKDSGIAPTCNQFLEPVFFWQLPVLQTAYDTSKTVGLQRADSEENCIGAFTTSESIEETCRRLQSLLESQVGQLLKNGGAVPLPRFSSPTDFGGHLGSEPASEIVCMRQFSVEIPD